jgi:hypothetical protein
LQLAFEISPRLEGGVHTIGSGLARAFFTFCSIGRCSHVFGLLMRFTGLKERQRVATLQLAANDYLATGINAMDPAPLSEASCQNLIPCPNASALSSIAPPAQSVILE